MGSSPSAGTGRTISDELSCDLDNYCVVYSCLSGVQHAVTVPNLHSLSTTVEVPMERKGASEILPAS